MGFLLKRLTGMLYDSRRLSSASVPVRIITGNRAQALIRRHLFENFKAVLHREIQVQQDEIWTIGAGILPLLSKVHHCRLSIAHDDYAGIVFRLLDDLPGEFDIARIIFHE